MRHFISFQKRRSIYVGTGVSNVDNRHLVHQLNHELIKYGYVLSKPLFERLVKQEASVLTEIYTDIQAGIKEIVGGDGYSPTYANFPQSVLDMSYEEFFINAILYYWTGGEWRSEDSKRAANTASFNNVSLSELKTVKLDTEKDFNAIFTNILYSKSSISAFDKKIVDWFIDNEFQFDFKRISFNETKAYISRKQFENDKLQITTRDAKVILMTWAAWSNQDEGLKEFVKFKNPHSRLRNKLLYALDKCYNLEETFKVYREKWLKALFYLHPTTNRNKELYPNVARWTELLRKDPKQLKTFMSRVEEAIANKDSETAFDLLSKRPGVFTRMLDSLYRKFGMETITRWLRTKPLRGQLLTAYNHFSTRDEETTRSTVLAGRRKSEATMYGSLKALSTREVETILEHIMNTFKALYNDTETKIWIDKSLYFRPLTTNNRASSLALSSKSLGTVEVVPEDAKCIRTYVHWHGRSDIDLSAMVIVGGNKVEKVGWNGGHRRDDSIVYSGDNTGHNAKNAEYLDIYPDKLGNDVELIILDAKIYARMPSYAAYKGKARTGFMTFTKEQDIHQDYNWLPDTLTHSIVLSSESRTAFLLAYHPATRSIIYLDVAMGSRNVTGSAEALEMAAFVDKFIPYETTEISWKKLYQGHILELTAGTLVDNPRDADKVFGENTSSDEVETYL